MFDVTSSEVVGILNELEEVLLVSKGIPSLRSHSLDLPSSHEVRSNQEVVCRWSPV